MCQLSKRLQLAYLHAHMLNRIWGKCLQIYPAISRSPEPTPARASPIGRRLPLQLPLEWALYLWFSDAWRAAASPSLLLPPAALWREIRVLVPRFAVIGP